MKGCAGFRASDRDDGWLRCVLQLVGRDAELPRKVRYLVILEQPHVLRHNAFGGSASMAVMTKLEQEALLEDRERRLLSDRTHESGRTPARRPRWPRPHGGELLHGRDEIAVIVEIADDGFADITEDRLVGLRNRAVTGADRKKLVIDPGPRTISGAGTNEHGRDREYAFDTGEFAGSRSTSANYGRMKAAG